MVQSVMRRYEERLKEVGKLRAQIRACKAGTNCDNAKRLFRFRLNSANCDMWEAWFMLDASQLSHNQNLGR